MEVEARADHQEGQAVQALALRGAQAQAAGLPAARAVAAEAAVASAVAERPSLSPAQLLEEAALSRMAKGPPGSSLFPQVSHLQVDLREERLVKASTETSECRPNISRSTLSAVADLDPPRQYGSGYPGNTGLGVASRGFPFVFWPLVWGGGLGYGAAYLHSNHEVCSV